jgi:hypothetical protein
MQYSKDYHLKTDKLLDQGVQKVIWVFTGNEKIMEAEAGKHWITSGWTRTLPLPENVGLNLANLMAENCCNLENHLLTIALT